MKSPLTIFVTVSVYDIVCSVSYCKPNGETIRASKSKENIIDLDKVNRLFLKITNERNSTIEKLKKIWNLLVYVYLIFFLVKNKIS